MLYYDQRNDFAIIVWEKEMEQIRYDATGLMIVREDYCCEHFEPDDGALVPMKECWCCKWSNFRADSKDSSSESYSVCNYIGNMKEAVNK